MSEQTIIYHCSPTLAGIKTANLFACSYESRTKLIKEIQSFNKSLLHKGILMIPVRMNDGRALIYVYRPAKLESDLNDELAVKLLNEHGYESNKTCKCVLRLIQRLKKYDEFPHEIGLFLGYPPEDVEGFIRHKGNDCKCAGYWKVYGDERKARQRFKDYKKCTRIYCYMYANGKSIERLTVPV